MNNFHRPSYLRAKTLRLQKQGLAPLFAQISSASMLIAEPLAYEKRHATSLFMQNSDFYHIQYLHTELERRVAKNPQYSLRSFARDLSITSSWLSEVLSGKKGMSLEKAESLCFGSGLSSVESKLFQLSVRAAHSRSPKDRKSALMELKKFKVGRSSLQRMKNEDFQPLSDWYYLALLELTELPECQHSEAWFAKKLKLPERLIKSALAKLIEKRHLEIKNGRYVATYTESSTLFDVPSDSIKKYHQQMMTVASQALHEQSVQQRDFLNMTLAFDATRTEEAQKVLRKFQQDFAKQFYPESSDNKNSVYQLSIQFFRLDTKGE